MMTKRLLFTAVTRAKETDIIYYEGTSLTDAIKDKAERKRMTLFSQILQKSVYFCEKSGFLIFCKMKKKEGGTGARSLKNYGKID